MDYKTMTLFRKIEQIIIFKSFVLIIFLYSLTLTFQIGLGTVSHHQMTLNSVPKTFTNQNPVDSSLRNQDCYVHLRGGECLSFSVQPKMPCKHFFKFHGVQGTYECTGRLHPMKL
jgi:hypothetical protein